MLLLLGSSHLAQLDPVGSSAALEFQQREPENGQRQQHHNTKRDPKIKIPDATCPDQTHHVNVHKIQRRDERDKVGRPLNLDDRRQ